MALDNRAHSGSCVCVCVYETDTYINRWRERGPGLSVKDALLFICVLVRSCITGVGNRLERLPIEERLPPSASQKELKYNVHKHPVVPFPQSYDPNFHRSLCAIQAATDSFKRRSEGAQGGGGSRRRLYGCRRDRNVTRCTT